MNITRRQALAGIAAVGGLAPGIAAGQVTAFSPAAFNGLVDDICKRIEGMEAQVAGSAPAPSLPEAVEAMGFLFENLPQLFEWMEAVRDGAIPEPTDAELDQLAAAVERAQDCAQRYQSIAEDWSTKFGPDLAGTSGASLVDVRAFQRQKTDVFWRCAAVVTLAAVLLRGRFAGR